MSQEPISIIVLEPVIDSMAALVRVLEQSPQVEMISIPSVEEAHQAALQFQPCVMLISMRGTLDGAAQVDLLKKVEKPIRSGQIKPLVISTVKNHPLAVAISTIGVKDYVEEPTNTKSLLFKMNLFFKAINAFRQKSEKNKNSETTVFKAKPFEEVKESTVVASKVSGKYKPALQLAEDTFVFKGSLPRKVNNKLLLEAEGPAPETGEWNELPTKAGEQKKWKWVPKKEAEAEVPRVQEEEESGWVHEGDKPSYNVSDGKWQLLSNKPRLDFYKNGKPIANKVETDEEGRVLIAEDSQAARDNLVLNKTMAKQAQEDQLKQAVLEQEAEEKEKRDSLLKLMPVKKRDSGAAPVIDEEAEREAFSKLAKRARDKRRGAPPRVGGGDSSEDDEAEWKSKIAAKDDAPETVNNNIDSLESNAEQNIRDKRSEEDANAAKELSLHTREKKLEGLKKDDLTGEQNLRDRMRDELELSLAQDSLQGISDDQLNEEVNFQESRNSKLLELNPTDSEASLSWNEGLSDRDQKLAKARKKKIQKKALGEHRKKKPKLSKEKLEKLAQDRIKAILALMAVDEVEDKNKNDLEKVSPEEEARLRKELDIEDGVDVALSELHRLQHEKKKQHRKKEIKQLEDALENGITALETIFFNEDADDWNEQDLSAEERERNFRAIESADEDLYDDDDSHLATKKSSMKAKSRSSAEDTYFYLAQSEVEPEDGRWICEEEKWLYLSNQIFETGFEHLEDLLPAWVFDGSDEPLLMLAEKKWRFAGSEPYRVESPSDLSFALKDRLQSLTKKNFDREQRRNNREKEDERLAEEGRLKIEAVEAERLRRMSLQDPSENNMSDGAVAEESLPAEDLGNVSAIDDSGLDALGKVTAETAQDDLGSVAKDESSKAAFGKVQLQEMLEGDLGNVKVEDDEQNRLGKVSFDEEKFAEQYNLKELLVFVKINDAKRNTNNLEKDITMILRLMGMAFLHLNFEYVKDTAPLGLVNASESLHSFGNLFVSTSSPDGKFSDREIFIVNKFAQALGLLLSSPTSVVEKKAA